jgi:hypothetical protein
LIAKQPVDRSQVAVPAVIVDFGFAGAEAEPPEKVSDLSSVVLPVHVPF